MTRCYSVTFRVLNLVEGEPVQEHAQLLSRLGVGLRERSHLLEVRRPEFLHTAEATPAEVKAGIPDRCLEVPIVNQVRLPASREQLRIELILVATASALSGRHCSWSPTPRLSKNRHETTDAATAPPTMSLSQRQPRTAGTAPQTTDRSFTEVGA